LTRRYRARSVLTHHRPSWSSA